MVLILDNAAYHHARLHKPWREARTERLSLEFLPPYSPELNPIERVWKFTRHRRLHNRYFPRLEQVIETVEWEFAAWARYSESLRRLCAIIEDAKYSKGSGSVVLQGRNEASRAR